LSLRCVQTSQSSELENMTSQTTEYYQISVMNLIRLNRTQGTQF